MAVVLGTSSGFVIVVPTADPAGSNTTIDGSSVVTKHTSPVGANAITEVGWYRGVGTNTANFEIALYADNAGAPGARLFVDNTNSSNVQGWIVTTVNWAVSESTDYWLAVQMDAHSGSSSIDTETAGGAGSDVLTSQTTLADPYGGGAVADADGMYAIYAKTSIARNITPDVGALTLAGFSPTIVTSDHKIVLADVGALTLSGFSPTVAVTNHLNVAAGLGELTLTGFEPTVSVTQNLNVAADTGVLLVTGFEPTIETPQNINADTGVITISGLEPTVTASDHKNVLAGLGEVLITGFEPTVSIGDNAEALPGLGEISLTGFAPSVETPVNVNTDKGELTVNGFSPSVVASDHKVVNPDTGVLLLTGFAPEVTGGSTVGSGSAEPFTGQFLIEGFAPSVMVSYKMTSEMELSRELGSKVHESVSYDSIVRTGVVIGSEI